jgi:hypothetical protein
MAPRNVPYRSARMKPSADTPACLSTPASVPRNSKSRTFERAHHFCPGYSGQLRHSPRLGMS